MQVFVVYNSIRSECSIDINLPLNLIIKTICNTLNLASVAPSSLCLRITSDSEKLLTDENIRRGIIQHGDTLKLVESPAVLASRYVRELDSEDDASLKKSLFMLQNQLVEEEFTEEFILRNGLKKLKSLVVTSQGNTLAYALGSLHSLMDHSHRWDDFSLDFIKTLLSIIIKQNLGNICRQATSVIIKLVLADGSNPNASVQNYGFEIINKAMSTQLSILPALVRRLTSTEFSLQVGSLNLINVLFRHATDRFKDEFIYKLDSLGIRNVLVGIMIKSHAEELSKSLQEFQRLLILEGNRRKRLQVDLMRPGVPEMFESIWRTSRMVERGEEKWRLIGFETEHPHREFTRVGVLGLELYCTFANDPSGIFSKFVHEQIELPENRRCPLVRAHVEVLDIIADHWEFSTGYSTTTSCQPLIFVLEAVHNVTLRLFIRLWLEMDLLAHKDTPSSSVSELDDILILPNKNEAVVRVGSVVRSQFRYVVKKLSNASPTILIEFEREMLEASYSVLRERQLADLESEDAIMTKLPVRKLRDHLYTESYEFIKSQRISCLTSGSWFAVPNSKGKGKNQLRFYRLSANGKYLHYSELRDTMPDNTPQIEELPLKTEMALVTDIITGQSSHTFLRRINNFQDDLNLCFSLVTSTGDTDLFSSLDFICTSSTQYSEWMDGFNMLLDRNITTDDTSKYVRNLTDIRVKLALLDLTGERIEIPSMVDIPGEGNGRSPIDGTEYPNDNFWYDESPAGFEDAWRFKDHIPLRESAFSESFDESYDDESDEDHTGEQFTAWNGELFDSEGFDSDNFGSGLGFKMSRRISTDP